MQCFRHGNNVEFLRISKKANMTGKIKTLVPAKGFGFIEREGEAKDLFFHSSALEGVMFDDLKQGDIVSFEVVDGMKGPAAEHVTRA
ncbi:MAG: cold shock domain-containing protein [Patescibacteria group bacterium]